MCGLARFIQRLMIDNKCTVFHFTHPKCLQTNAFYHNHIQIKNEKENESLTKPKKKCVHGTISGTHITFLWKYLDEKVKNRSQNGEVHDSHSTLISWHFCFVSLCLWLARTSCAFHVFVCRLSSWLNRNHPPLTAERFRVCVYASSYTLTNQKKNLFRIIWKDSYKNLFHIFFSDFLRFFFLLFCFASSTYSIYSLRLFGQKFGKEMFFYLFGCLFLSWFPFGLWMCSHFDYVFTFISTLFIFMRFCSDCIRTGFAVCVFFSLLILTLTWHTIPCLFRFLVGKKRFVLTHTDTEKHSADT